MDDVIRLTGLRVLGHHGVLSHERLIAQEFVVDVALGLDTTLAAISDDVADTVHYGHLADRVAAIVSGDPVNLIETLANRIATAALADARVRWAEVCVHKPRAPIAQVFEDVSVTVRRSAGQQPSREEPR